MPHYFMGGFGVLFRWLFAWWNFFFEDIQAVKKSFSKLFIIFLRAFKYKEKSTKICSFQFPQKGSRKHPRNSEN
jgi:hypothetical protein